MKKLTTFLSAMALTGILYSQPDTTNLQRSQIKTATTQAINDLNERDVTAIPIKERENTSQCNTRFSKIGVADLERLLVKQMNSEGKWENSKENSYKVNIVVTYDCKDYIVKIRGEPYIFEENSLVNKNKSKNPYTLIIKKQNNEYKINSDLELRTLTKKYIKRIYNESIEMSKDKF